MSSFDYDDEDETEEPDPEAVFAELLLEIIETSDLDALTCSTFADHGMLSGNAGLIVRTQSGAEFQLTIVQSR